MSVKRKIPRCKLFRQTLREIVSRANGMASTVPATQSTLRFCGALLRPRICIVCAKELRKGTSKISMLNFLSHIVVRYHYRLLQMSCALIQASTHAIIPVPARYVAVIDNFRTRKYTRQVIAVEIQVICGVGSKYMRIEGLKSCKSNRKRGQSHLIWSCLQFGPAPSQLSYFLIGLVTLSRR